MKAKHAWARLNDMSGTDLLASNIPDDVMRNMIVDYADRDELFENMVFAIGLAEMMKHRKRKYGARKTESGR